MCSDFRKEYDIAAINGLTVFGEHLLDLCFEDLADDSLTLTLTAFKLHPKVETTKRRKVAGEIREMVMEEEEEEIGTGLGGGGGG